MNLTLHYSLGLWIGTISLLPIIIHQLIAGSRFARDMATMLLVSNLMGIWAIVPNMLRHAGLPDSLSRHWSMNVFFLNPLLDIVFTDGMLKGESALIICFVLQYIIMLAAIKKSKLGIDR